MDEAKATVDQRQSRRVAIDAPVEILLEGAVIAGSGRNLSRTGILAVVPGGIRVKARFGGEERSGTVVRLQALDEKSWSLAVKFDQPLPE